MITQTGTQSEEKHNYFIHDNDVKHKEYNTSLYSNTRGFEITHRFLRPCSRHAAKGGLLYISKAFLFARAVYKATGFLLVPHSALQIITSPSFKALTINSPTSCVLNIQLNRTEFYFCWRFTVLSFFDVVWNTHTTESNYLCLFMFENSRSGLINMLLMMLKFGGHNNDSTQHTTKYICNCIL